MASPKVSWTDVVILAGFTHSDVRRFCDSVDWSTRWLTSNAVPPPLVPLIIWRPEILAQTLEMLQSIPFPGGYRFHRRNAGTATVWNGAISLDTDLSVRQRIVEVSEPKRRADTGEILVFVDRETVITADDSEVSISQTTVFIGTGQEERD